MKTISKQQQYKTLWIVVIHGMLWALLGFVLLFYPPLSWNVELPFVFWVKQCLSMFLLAVIFYLNYFVVTPNYLFQDKLGRFFVFILLFLVSLQVLNYAISNLLSFDQMMASVRHRPPPREFRLIDSFVLMLSLLVLGISTAIAAVQRWQKDARLGEELQKQQIEAELSFLKGQINPHFFFNTLNSIYSLSYTDVELSREALHKLSRMMRYLLYETQQNLVSLKKEIDFLRDHIALMSLRLHSNNQIEFREPKMDKDFMIAPMLLLPFVENALKHGISTSKHTHILIDLEILSPHTLHLRVENDTFQEQKLMQESGGIGLQNTKRRLDLQYPSKYTLSHGKDEQHRYIVDLKLDLS
ncbi:sensor histidine kinase [Olivibacter sitiensis]|uniref:sensor histidine kinase n=1 Tax=Olivibacter sitiensis TaxID=376470 RepID=UPI0004185FF9|nr:histidine kinase [Olivibacter sitiensis]